MKKYALINYTTGEIYSMSSEDSRFTAQALYKRAESLRRECIRYGYRQSRLELVDCSMCPNKVLDGKTIQLWYGEDTTPLEDMGFSVRTYHMLKKRGCDVARLVADYAMGTSIFWNIPRKSILEIERILRAYDIVAAQTLRRNINKRRGEQWGLQ